MSALSTILAKSNPAETLEGHTTEVLKVWQKLRKRYGGIIREESFWRDSFYAIAFHDFGKICSNFQETITGKRAFNNDERIRHEFFSGMFLFSNNHTYLQKHPESLIAVFSHHKPFNENGFNCHIFRNMGLKYTIERNVIDEFLEFIAAKAVSYGIAPYEVNAKLKYFIINDYPELLKWYKQKIYDQISAFDYLKLRNRTTYIFHKAILNISDWTASGHLQLEGGITYNDSYIKEKIIAKLIEEGNTEVARKFKFRKFQEAGLKKQNVIALAPTGSGKTEAALLWASGKEDWERMIYLLPTRVTSNAIYQRLKAYFGTEIIQLIHSSARLYLKDQDDGSYDQNYLRNKSFFKNINVCTVDQILTQGFNLGFWEVKTFHMLNARVIIDEIHLYSPYTLALIISTIRYLREHFNSRFYIMTATMPQKLLSLLTEALGDATIVRDSELLASARNRFEVRTENLKELTEEIAEHVMQGKKVLVVTNTVDNAIEIFNTLTEKTKTSGRKAICYHSRYINKDRVRKEQAIFEMDRSNMGGLLVATQVVEVSLDIDFDVLFTENAPIDAVIQRAGRVNRKRSKKDSKVIIAQHSDISNRVYDTENILHDTYQEFAKVHGKHLTENDLNNMVDEVYKTLNITDNPNYKDGLHKHFEIQHQYNFIKDLTSDEKVFTREGLNTISVIPDCFYETLQDTNDDDEWSRHELSVKAYWRSNVKKVNGYSFLAGEYTYETGFNPSKKKAIETF